MRNVSASRRGGRARAGAHLGAGRAYRSGAPVGVPGAGCGELAGPPRRPLPDLGAGSGPAGSRRPAHSLLAGRPPGLLNTPSGPVWSLPWSGHAARAPSGRSQRSSAYVPDLSPARASREGGQAIFIALGLALGIGRVIAVTAASSGVKNAQGQVLHALYGVGTDVTVNQDAHGRLRRRWVRLLGAYRPDRGGEVPRSGTKIKVENGPHSAWAPCISRVTSIARLSHVGGAAGGLGPQPTRRSAARSPAINKPAAVGRGLPARRRWRLPRQLQRR